MKISELQIRIPYFFPEKTPQKIQARLMNYKEILVNVKPNNFCGCKH